MDFKNPDVKYLIIVLFCIPVNIYIFPGGLGAGIQWVFFRYQNSVFGSSFITVDRDIYFLTTGIISGKTALAECALVAAAVCFFIAVLLLLSDRTKTAGVTTIVSGILLLSSSMIQYGPFFSGASGISIPVGIPLIFVTGAFLTRYSRQETALPPQVNLLEKYDYLVLFFLIFTIYSSLTLQTYANDAIPSMLLPYYILHDHTIYLDQATEFLDTHAYSLRFVNLGNGHYASLFPIVTPILVLPFYSIPVLLNLPMNDMILLEMGSAGAAVLCALAGVFIFLACKRITTRKIAVISALVFALATSTWSTSSITLWNHAAGEMLLAATIFFIVRNESEKSVANMVFLGIASGLYIFNRPSDAVLIVPVILYAFFCARDHFTWYGTSAVLSGLPFLTYNFLIFGSPLGGYLPIASRLGLRPDTLGNFLGLFIAPNKGLLIFSPVLILAILGFLVIGNTSDNRFFHVLSWFIPAMLANIVIYSLFDDWIGGTVYGPRYLTSILPVLAVVVCIALDHIFITGSYSPDQKKAAAVIIAVMIAVSVLIQFIGAFFYIAAAETGSISPADHNPWDMKNSIIIHSVFSGYPNLTYQIHTINASFFLDRRDKKPGAKLS